MNDRDRFSDTVGRKAERRSRARRRPGSIWTWLGMLGLVGWSVAVPTVLGIGLGGWLDREVPVPFSWQLTLLVVGLAVGVLNAWYWVLRESTDGEPDVRDDDPARAEEGNGR